ncbi:transposase [Streptomyces sp. NPDC001276]|uniref:transposase n=1 Tax=Streptomyces sp. NPDC001276 TaxID=3364555 RepID=UPI0036B7F5D1
MVIATDIAEDGRVHFLRNVFGVIPKDAGEMVAATTHTIFAQPDPDAVRNQLHTVADCSPLSSSRSNRCSWNAKNNLSAALREAGGYRRGPAAQLARRHDGVARSWQRAVTEARTMLEKEDTRPALRPDATPAGRPIAELEPCHRLQARRTHDRTRAARTTGLPEPAPARHRPPGSVAVPWCPTAPTPR